jgi:uncharacterized sodium:solute symporter family permease YidK
MLPMSHEAASLWRLGVLVGQHLVQQALIGGLKALSADDQINSRSL